MERCKFHNLYFSKFCVLYFQETWLIIVPKDSRNMLKKQHFVIFERYFLQKISSFSDFLLNFKYLHYNDGSKITTYL